MNSVKKILGSKAVAWALSCAMLFSATSCLDDDDSSKSNVPVAYVSLYHGSPDAPDLDVEVDDNQINSEPFDYAEYTGYLRFYTGDRNLKFGPYQSSSINIDTTITFERDKAYSVFIADEFDQAGIVVLNDNTDVPSSGKAKVRIINLSPDAGNIDLMREDDTNTWASDLEFKDATEFTEVSSGQVNLEVRDSEDGNVLLSIPSTQFQARYYYTIIIRGYKTPPTGNTNVLAAQIVVN